MTKTIQEERLRWIKPILNKKIRIVDLAKVCPYSQRSLERWLSNYRKDGEKGLIPKSTKPKRSPNRTPGWIRDKIIRKRKETRLCAQKIHWKLKKEGLRVPVRTIGKVIRKKRIN